MIVVVFLLVAAVVTPAKTFTAERCRCSFAVPSGWVVVANPKARLPPLRRALPEEIAPCAFGLKPRSWPRIAGRRDRDFGDYAITIHVTNQRFRDAARDGFFIRVDALRKELGPPEAQPDKKPTDWMLRGRQAGLHDTTWIRSPNWFGLRGIAAVGYYVQGAGYQGMDDAYRAVLSNGRWRSAIVMADNPFTGRELHAVVDSFRFE